ncbi:hypothetical protein ScPMuIL_006062 [Solemya velum]
MLCDVFPDASSSRVQMTSKPSSQLKPVKYSYESAKVNQPEVIYVDRDCCGGNYVGKKFPEWSELHVRLDIWHYMRRISSACTTESHILYPMFMRRLSGCIFQWSADDLEALKSAKTSQVQQQKGVLIEQRDLSDWISKKELALHYQRTTRTAEEIWSLASQLICTFSGDQGREAVSLKAKRRIAKANKTKVSPKKEAMATGGICWSTDDLKALKSAKTSQVQQQKGVLIEQRDLSDWISKKELALHCRRTTRTAEEIRSLVSQLIFTFSGDQGRGMLGGMLGVPLLDKQKAEDMWDSQRRVTCIQDPPGVTLYTHRGTLEKVPMPMMSISKPPKPSNPNHPPRYRIADLFDMQLILSAKVYLEQSWMKSTNLQDSTQES